MSQYANDPRWIFARFDSVCPQCGAPIRKNDSVFYFPTGKKALCGAETCGKKASAEFEAAKADEAMMRGESW